MLKKLVFALLLISSSAFAASQLYPDPTKFGPLDIAHYAQPRFASGTVTPNIASAAEGDIFINIATPTATALQIKVAGAWRSINGGGSGATLSCQARAGKEGGKLQFELFAGDLANWSFQSDAPLGSEWRSFSATLQYGWSDEQATAAGWRRAANGFSWSETIQHVGQVVILPTAAGTSGRLDLDEIAVRGEP